MLNVALGGPSPLIIPRMRGGLLHNYLAARAAEIFKAFGLEARTECPLRLRNGRLDFVDLLVWGGNHALACEVETTPRHVLANVEKAQALKLPLWVIVPNRQICRTVSRKVWRSWSGRGGPVIKFLTISQLPRTVVDCFPLIFPANKGWEDGKTIQSTAGGVQAASEDLADLHRVSLGKESL